MDFDRKEFSSYLDGVPFTVGQKFCPPRTVTLPDSIGYELPPELLSEEYDFSMENKVLAICKKKEEEKTKKPVEKLPEKGPLEPVPVSGDNSVIVQPVITSIPLWPASSILQPKSKAPVIRDASSSVSDNMKKINFSDFENDTPSPFDLMELRTINDLEELSTVFEGLCKSQKEPAPTKLPPDSRAGAMPSEGMQGVGGNVSKSISFPLPEKFDLNNSVQNSGSSQYGATSVSSSSVSKSFIKNGENYLSYSYPSMPDAFSRSGIPLTNDRAKRNSFISDSIGSSHSALSQVPFATSFADQNRTLPGSSYTGVMGCSAVPLRSSKSIPDLTNLAPNHETVPKVERSHTPPASRTVDVSEEPRETDVHPMAHDVPNASLKQNVWTSNGLLTCTAVQPEKSLDLPDPYNELNSSERQIVDFIVDMGFQQGLVSRTVKHLGTDEKKSNDNYMEKFQMAHKIICCGAAISASAILEHLCEIQTLEESGYDKLEAETALHLHDYNKHEAKRYLDLLNQFQDLGFEKDAIKKALVQNKNDRDKVIDALLS